jgi:hypothetical protein
MVLAILRSSRPRARTGKTTNETTGREGERGGAVGGEGGAAGGEMRRRGREKEQASQLSGHRQTAVRPARRQASAKRGMQLEAAS